MGKEDARALADYHKHVQKQIEAMTPWKSKHRRDLSNIRKTVKSGQVVVIPDGSDVGNPLYKDADIQQKDSG